MMERSPIPAQKAARFPVEGALLFWFIATPVASYFIRFPAEQSLVTFDRLVFGIAALALIVGLNRKGDSAGQEPAAVAPCNRGFTVTRFELAWVLLSVIAVASVTLTSNDAGYATRIAIDSFCLPLIAFHMARYHFELRGHAAKLLLGAQALAIFLCACGLYELATGDNLFAYRGSDLVRDGEIRVNGPFASDSSFAVICLLLTVFLALAPQFLAVRMDAPARLFHILALSAAVTGSLLPLYRVMILALLACLLIIRMGKPASAQQAAGARPGLRSIASGLRSRFTKRAFSASRLFAAMVLLSMLAAVWLAIFGLSSPSRRLASPRNAYGRIATWEAAVGISLDHPASGVGLANYTSYFERKFSQSGSPIQSVNESRAAAYPHSNPLWIAAELGVPGFALYITANVYMFLLGFRALKRATDAAGRLTAACYLTLMAGYWVPGLTLTSGAYSDLNLYYFFLLGLLSRK